MVVKRDLGVHSGKLTGFRALEEGKFEASIRGSGTFVGKEIKEFGTMTMEVLENGATRMSGVGTLITDGGSATWAGFGIAKNEGLTFPAGNYACAGQFLKATGTLESLVDVVLLAEFAVDEDENYHWKAFEWAHQ